MTNIGWDEIKITKIQHILRLAAGQTYDAKMKYLLINFKVWTDRKFIHVVSVLCLMNRTVKLTGWNASWQWFR